MNRSDSPKKQPKPFGVNGQRGAILPTTPAGDNSASYEQGFPPITMILKSAGGLPPKGQDMNQILYELSALGRWSSTGALNTFDSEFASEISGYPSGAMLISDDGERIFINTTEGNLSDPNSNGAGWKDVLSYLGLGEAAKRNVGTGSGQIPDMSSFASALSLSGYQKLPSGLIIQWGAAAAGIGRTGGTGNVVSFPVAFPRYCAQIITSYDNGSSSIIAGAAGNQTTTQFLLRCDATGGSYNFRWLAVGY
ncbi:hypothetical protein P5Z53_003175 [Escherichia coli]|nr:hypothetical protein [Escherichia coli]